MEKRHIDGYPRVIAEININGVEHRLVQHRPWDEGRLLDSSSATLERQEKDAMGHPIWSKPPKGSNAWAQVHNVAFDEWLRERAGEADSG
jgi:hypothetical protein